MIIRSVRGGEVRPKLEPFYQSGKMSIQVRDDDKFFLAEVAEEIIGAVRFCVEDDAPLLRSMLVEEKFRRTGIGQRLLDEFRSYLDQNKIRPTYLVCPARLEKFYGGIGFQKMEPSLGPSFLHERLLSYKERNPTMLMMQRP